MTHIEVVLLDRDGVINHDSDAYIKSVEEWRPLPGAIDAIVQLQQHVQVAVCTNQSGVGRGMFTTEILASMHAKMNQLIAAAGGTPVDVWFCPHTPDAGCTCRKPAPGLLQTAMQALGAEPRHTVYIGDSEKDLLAALDAGCVPVLVRTGKGGHTETSATAQQLDHVYDDLPAAATALLAHR